MQEFLHGQFVDVEELRKNLSNLLAALEAEGSELVVTRQGKPKAVIVDLEKYLEVQQALKEFSDSTYLRELLEAREEIRAGKGRPASDIFREKGV